MENMLLIIFQIIIALTVPVIGGILFRIFKLLDRQNKWMQRISDNDIRQNGKLETLEKTSLNTLNILDKTRLQVFENKDELLKIKAASG